MRRDLRDLDPDFLASQIDATLLQYLKTFWSRNATIGLALFDREDVGQELVLLLLEEARRFDGRGSFVAWACSRQRQRLIDVARRAMGRRVCDANTRAARGEALADDEAALVAAWRAVHRPALVDDWSVLDRSAVDEGVRAVRPLPRERFCAEEGCERLIKTRGLCNAHYLRTRQRGVAL